MKKLLIFLSGVIVGVIGVAFYELFGRPVEPTPPENYKPDYNKDIQFSFTQKELKQLAEGLKPSLVSKEYDFEEVITRLAQENLKHCEKI